tara:strand:+ start:614 stop:925 length:312 start_codon:yes stop_codon:yes gene_type:complete
MFKKSAIFVIFCFFLLTITTSLTKNKARNLEKEILKLEKEISQIEKQISDAEIDYIYLSKPKKLITQIKEFKSEEYLSYDRSKIFFSINHFLEQNSKISKYIK